MDISQRLHINIIFRFSNTVITSLYKVQISINDNRNDRLVFIVPILSISGPREIDVIRTSSSRYQQPLTRIHAAKLVVTAAKHAPLSICVFAKLIHFAWSHSECVPTGIVSVNSRSFQSTGCRFAGELCRSLPREEQVISPARWTETRLFT